MNGLRLERRSHMKSLTKAWSWVKWCDMMYILKEFAWNSFIRKLVQKMCNVGLSFVSELRFVWLNAQIRDLNKM